MQHPPPQIVVLRPNADRPIASRWDDLCHHNHVPHVPHAPENEGLPEPRLILNGIMAAATTSTMTTTPPPSNLYTTKLPPNCLPSISRAW
jgi:hypothetical protein